MFALDGGLFYDIMLVYSQDSNWRLLWEEY